MELLDTLLDDQREGKPLNTGICRYIERRHGVRFCKRCSKLLPLDAFKRGARTYTCLAHAAPPPEPRPCTHRKAATNMHLMAHRDRGRFGQQAVLLSAGEMASILCQHGVTDPGDAVRWSFVPLNPLLPLSSQNFRLLSKRQRRPLMARWASSGNNPHAYSMLLHDMLTQERGRRV
jgi:hypothetical protein